MNIFDKEDENFKKIQEEMGNSKRMISKLDFADAIGEVVSSAMSAMVLAHDIHFANLMAAIAAKRPLDKLFPKESRDEGEKDTENVSDTKQDAEKWSTDLKHRLFMHAADYRLPLQTTVENYKTEEQRRLAKYTALLSLILDAGLNDEYKEWLDTVYGKED